MQSFLANAIRKKRNKNIQIGKEESLYLRYKIVYVKSWQATICFCMAYRIQTNFFIYVW